MEQHEGITVRRVVEIVGRLPHPPSPACAEPGPQVASVLMLSSMGAMTERSAVGLDPAR